MLDTGGWSGETHQIFEFLIFCMTSAFNFHPILVLYVKSHAVCMYVTEPSDVFFSDL